MHIIDHIIDLLFVWFPWRIFTDNSHNIPYLPAAQLKTFAEPLFCQVPNDVDYKKWDKGQVPYT